MSGKKCDRTLPVSYLAYREPQEVQMEILVILSPESEDLAGTEAMWRFSDQDARQIRCLIGSLRTLGGSTWSRGIA